MPGTRTPGAEIEIFSLLTPPDEPRHDLLAKLKAKVTYLDECSAASGRDLSCDPKFDLFFTGKSQAARDKLIVKASRIARLAEAAGCGHIHAHFGSDTTTVAALAAHDIGVGYSYTAHAKDIYHTYVDSVSDAAVRRAKIQHAAFVVTVSDYNKAHLSSLARPEDRSKIVRLYNGVDLSRFAFVDGQDREPATVLAVGRLVEKKGYADLISALALIRKRRSDVRCVICGDGGSRPALEEQIGKTGLTSAVTLLGAVDQSEIIRQMRRATMLVLPAIVTDTGDRDALPTVLLEAQAIGLPVISTPVCGIPEIIKDGDTGCLVPERSPAAVAEAALRLIEDKALRDRLPNRHAPLRNGFSICRHQLRHLPAISGARLRSASVDLRIHHRCWRLSATSALSLREFRS